MRLETFLTNKDLVTMHNELYSAGKVTYTMELNEFADMVNIFLFSFSFLTMMGTNQNFQFIQSKHWKDVPLF